MNDLVDTAVSAGMKNINRVSILRLLIVAGVILGLSVIGAYKAVKVEEIKAATARPLLVVPVDQPSVMVPDVEVT